MWSLTCPSIVWLVAAVGVMMVMATAPAEGATTYYVSAGGSDANSGKSPAKPWRSLERVNLAELKPGDTVRFRRGDTWRGSLRPKSGAPGAAITYAAYGKGPKPTFLGSVSRNDPADWTDEGGSIWSTGGTPTFKTPDLPPVSAAERAIRWSLYTESGAVAQGKAGVDAAYSVICDKPGVQVHTMQLCATGLRIKAGKTYRLLIRARSTKPFDVPMPTLMKADSPWNGYSSGPAPATVGMGADWAVCAQYYRATVDSDNARLTLYLGGAIPADCTFEVDRTIFAECPASEVPADSVLPVDVGNLIFGNEDGCGWKVWRLADVNAQGRFWYDPRSRKVYLFSGRNPAERYGKVECALYRHIIDESGVSYATYEDLALKYGAAHGVGGGSTHHIVVRNCDISYIGGADQMGGGQQVRFGNGIEFWGAAHDNLVEGCRIWEIYDAALTHQNMGDVVREVNITYRNNIIWNSEYSFEYWNRPAESVTSGIRFIHNTCVNAGHGWSHAQRPDPSGRHLCFYASQAADSDFVVANNIFCEAATNALYAPDWSKEALAKLTMDGNLWLQKKGAMISADHRFYPLERFAEYQAAHATEAHSRTGDPLFRNAAAHDYRLRPGSPAIGGGVPLDANGRPASSGKAPDVGALPGVAK